MPSKAIKWSYKSQTIKYVSSSSLHQYVTLRTQYSELMTLTSQYIKFITDSQRRLEDDEVRENSWRVPNKLNSNNDMLNQLMQQPPLFCVNAQVISALGNISDKMQIHL